MSGEGSEGQCKDHVSNAFGLFSNTNPQVLISDEIQKPLPQLVRTEHGSLLRIGRRNQTAKIAVAHPLNLPAGGRVLAPSAVAAGGQMWTDQQQMQPEPTPGAMTEADLQQALEEYVQLFHRVPDRRRGTFLAVVRATAKAVRMDDSAQTATRSDEASRG